MGLRDWFGKGRRAIQPQEEWWERIEKLESAMDQLQLDWENTYAKVRRALAMLGKREKALEERESGEASPAPNGNGSLLTPSEQGRILREARARRGF